MPRKLPNRFIVAFSYASEQRGIVKPIAVAAEDQLGKDTVFYDEWYEYHLNGFGGNDTLGEIYSARTAMVVVCVSEEYGRKTWTREELDAINARKMRHRVSANNKDRLRIFLLRVGDGSVPGIPSNAIYSDARTKSAAEIVQLLVNRLDELSALPVVAPGNSAPVGPAKIADVRNDIGPMWYDNPWYIARKVDQELLGFLNFDGRTAALLGGPQMGKSSLVVRIEKRLEAAGYHRVSLNLRSNFTAEDFADEGHFFAALATIVARTLHVATPSPDRFAPHVAPAEIATFFIDEILPKVSGKLLIVFDRFDHLFEQPCSLPVQSGLRALHDMTAGPPLDDLRLILIYTVRPQQEHNQYGSILEVAVPHTVEDFTQDEVRHLNSLHGNLRAPDDVADLHRFLGGHPLLTRQAWNTMASKDLPAQTLIEEAMRDGGIFKPHLRKLLLEFQKSHRHELAKAFLNLIDGKGCPSEEVFQALLAIGVVKGTHHGDATVRCGLYAIWFPPRLR